MLSAQAPVVLSIAAAVGPLPPKLSTAGPPWFRRADAIIGDEAAPPACAWQSPPTFVMPVPVTLRPTGCPIQPARWPRPPSDLTGWHQMARRRTRRLVTSGP